MQQVVSGVMYDNAEAYNEGPLTASHKREKKLHFLNPINQTILYENQERHIHRDLQPNLRLQTPLEQNVMPNGALGTGQKPFPTSLFSDERPVSTLKFLSFNAGLLEYSILGAKLYQNPPFTNQRLLQLPGKTQLAEICLGKCITLSAHSIACGCSLTAALLSSGADILALQEIYDEKHVQFLLENVLVDYPYSGRETSGSRLALHNGLLFLSKFPIIRTQFHPLKQVTPLEWIFGSKGILEATISIPGIGAVTLFNMHMASGAVDPESNFVETVRSKEIHQLLDVCKNAGYRGEIPIVIGDLNADPELCASNYKAFLEDGWVDSWLFSSSRIDPYSFVLKDFSASGPRIVSAEPCNIRDLAYWLIDSTYNTIHPFHRPKSHDLGHSMFTFRRSASAESTAFVAGVLRSIRQDDDDEEVEKNLSASELQYKRLYSNLLTAMEPQPDALPFVKTLVHSRAGSAVWSNTGAPNGEILCMKKAPSTALLTPNPTAFATKRQNSSSDVLVHLSDKGFPVFHPSASSMNLPFLALPTLSSLLPTEQNSHKTTNNAYFQTSALTHVPPSYASSAAKSTLPLDAIVKDVTWDPRNPLNAIGPHRNCHGLRSDYIFLPPPRFAKQLRHFIPFKSKLLFQYPRVMIHTSKCDALRCVTVSDHYGVFVELRRRKL